MSRIGDIRKVIVDLGGNSDLVYYADGCYSSMGPKSGVNYKVEKFSDGLTKELREKAVVELAKLPGVDRAWISKHYKNSYSTNYFGHAPGEHIKVHYTNRAK